LTEKRPEYTKACVGQQASAISKMAGAAWKELSDVQKKPYEEKFVIVKAKYEKDLEAFLEAGGVKSKGLVAERKERREAKEGKGKKAKNTDPDKPKAPVGGGYGVFLTENRSRITESLPKDHKITDVGKAAGAEWKALSEDAKRPYEATYAKKREEYVKAMQGYTPPEAEVADVVEKADKKTPSKKRAKTETATPSPAAKVSRGAKKPSTSKGVEIDAEVLKEAENLKFVSQMKNLLGRPDVTSSGKSHKDMLDALKKNDGLVNKAKAALLGA
jgi:hypothetical protein